MELVKYAQKKRIQDSLVFGVAPLIEILKSKHSAGHSSVVVGTFINVNVPPSVQGSHVWLTH